MTRDEARAYFKDHGLTYDNITLDDLHYLKVLLNERFAQQMTERINAYRRNDGGYRKPTYWVRVNDAKYYKGKYTEDGRMVCAFLTGKGTYFEAREVISFERNGFIGFCGEADNENAACVLDAFCEWVDWLSE